MTKLERIEHQVQSLSPEELADFRRWFAEYDGAQWDRQFERDVADGKLDALRVQALEEHQANRTTEL